MEQVKVKVKKVSQKEVPKVVPLASKPGSSRGQQVDAEVKGQKVNAEVTEGQKVIDHWGSLETCCSIPPPPKPPSDDSKTAAMGDKPGEEAYLTTFVVSSATPEKVEVPENRSTGHVAKQLDVYREGKLRKILRGTKFPGKIVLPADNGLVRAITTAYNNHHHVIIRPDDVWLAIMTQFSFYVNARAEEFRSKFVGFEGKKQLVVDGIGTLYTVSYVDLVARMEVEIDKNLVDQEVRRWVMPAFSTTTTDDRVTFGVVFMATMKKYFDYEFCLRCGIPTVTLDGTLSDWQDIRRRLDKLDTYDLKGWTKLLKPILDEFVSAKAGQVNKDFWSKVCHYEGGRRSGPTYLSGWVTTFCLYDQDGKLQGRFERDKEWALVDTKAIPSGVLEVDVVVNDRGTKYDTVMLAGSMAMEVGPAGDSLQPRSGWVIALKGKSKESNANN